VLAALGILFLEFIFVPLAAMAIFGTLTAIKNSNGVGIGINLLA